MHHGDRVRIHITAIGIVVLSGLAAGAAGAVGQVGRNRELPLRAGRHELEGLDPAGDHAAHGEGGGLSAVDRTVEDRPVDERAMVVDRVLGLQYLWAVHSCFGRV